MHPSKALLHVSLLLAGTCGSLSAQLGIAIASPTNGAVIEDTASFYTPATQTIVVGGAISGLTSVTAAGYIVLVQGIVPTVTFIPPSTATFSIVLPAGPTAPAWFYGGGFPSWYPYLGEWSDINHVQKPLIAELYEIATSRVISRSRIVLFDKRYDPGLQPAYTGGKIENALAMEMSRSGLNALQRTHKGMLPQPSSTAFDTLLKNNFRGQAETVPNIDIGLTSPNAACMPLDKADPAFLNTSAYLTALADANGQLLTYNLWKAYTPITPLEAGIKTAVTAAACVRDPVTASDFELCVQTVKGNSQDLRLEGVDSVNLDVGSTSPIEAQVTLGRLTGTVNGELRDLKIRYDRNHIRPCLPPLPFILPLPAGIRPSANVDNTVLTSTPALASWASCTSLALSAASAQTQDRLTFNISTDTANAEQNLVQAATTPSPLFALGPNRNENTNHGTCGRTEFSPYVQDMLQRYYGRMRSAVDASWNQGQPNTQQAVALDKLFSRWEPGIYGDQPPDDHTMTLQYSAAATTIGSDRFWAKPISSDVHAHSPAMVAPAPATWVYSAPGDYPCLTSPATCTAARSFFGSAFDVSYSVTTGALNQVLKELSSTQRLRFELQPTYNDLGAPPVSPQTGTDKPALDGFVLKYLASPFADLGSNRVHIMLSPTFVPFTWMNPDPVGVPQGNGKVTYNMYAYLVDFVGDFPGPNGSPIWLRALVDFYDPNFNLTLHHNPARNLLEAAMSGHETFHLTILSTQLSSCGLSPMTVNLPPIVINSCNSALAGAIGGLVRPVLNTRLLDMLSRYPAPLTYDGAGAAASPKTVTQTERYQWQQILTFYGSLQ